MMWVFHPLNPESYQPGLRDELPATAGKGFMDGAQFVATKSHGAPLDGLNESVVGWQNQVRRTSGGGWYNSCPRRINVELGSCGSAVKERTRSSATQSRTDGRGFEGPQRDRRAARNYHKTRPCSGVGRETKHDVGGGAQTNCRSPARTVGKVEGSASEEIGRRLCADAIGSRQRSATCGTISDSMKILIGSRAGTSLPLSRWPRYASTPRSRDDSSASCDGVSFHTGQKINRSEQEPSTRCLKPQRRNPPSATHSSGIGVSFLWTAFTNGRKPHLKRNKRTTSVLRPVRYSRLRDFGTCGAIRKTTTSKPARS